MYSNYLETEDKEVIDKLSYFGFNGKYSKINDKYYIYIEKTELYAPRVGEITEEDLLRALGNKAIFVEKKILSFKMNLEGLSQKKLLCNRLYIVVR